MGHLLYRHGNHNILLVDLTLIDTLQPEDHDSQELVWTPMLRVTGHLITVLPHIW